jgi:hypothetical protein
MNLGEIGGDVMGFIELVQKQNSIADLENI